MWHRALQNRHFWEGELEKPIQNIRLGFTTKSEVLGGDANIAKDSDDHFPTTTHVEQGGKTKTATRPRRPAGTGAASSGSVVEPPPWNNDDGDLSEFVNGRYTKNRRGRKMCGGFQAGKCSGSTTNCPKKEAHQCSICLGNKHGANECPKRKQTGGDGKGGGKAATKRRRDRRNAPA